MRALVFPGQGSQKVGMGVELAEASRHARDVLAEVDDALSQSLSRLMREGPEDELTLTRNAQPAIMAASIAALRVLEHEFGVDPVRAFDCTAGHSLGEYSALCGADSFALADTARLLRLRGEAMQAAVPVGEGAMCALLGADLEAAERLAGAAARAAGGVCEIANDNDPGQVVLSGSAAAIDEAIALAKEHGTKRAVRLPVSAPFHCSLMAPAAERMAEALARTPPGTLSLPLYANITAARLTDADEERALLVQQVTGRVRWRESVLAMTGDGVEEFVELGGKVLGPMIGRTAPGVRTRSLLSMSDLEEFAKEIA